MSLIIVTIQHDIDMHLLLLQQLAVGSRHDSNTHAIAVITIASRIGHKAAIHNNLTPRRGVVMANPLSVGVGIPSSERLAPFRSRDRFRTRSTHSCFPSCASCARAALARGLQASKTFSKEQLESPYRLGL